MELRTRARHTPITLAVIVPLALIAGVFVLWSLSNDAVVVGPLDRAAFGWLVVVPMLASVPIIGGVFLARAQRRAHWPVAAFVGASAGLAVAFLFYRAVAMPACDFGAIRTAAEWLPNAAGFGLAFGAPLSAGLVSVARLWSEHRLGAVLAGLAASAAGYVLLAIVVGLSFQPLCNRP
jgi:hypothetical protein